MLIGFKEQFIEPILDGTKNFTLRAHRKVPPKIGERLFMYTGLRTKHCFKISDKHTLKAIQKVRLKMIKHSGLSLLNGCYVKDLIQLEIHIDGRPITKLEETMEFVKRDGFKSPTDFVNYWFSTKKKHQNEIIATLQQFHWTDKTF